MTKKTHSFMILFFISLSVSAITFEEHITRILPIYQSNPSSLSAADRVAAQVYTKHTGDSSYDQQYARWYASEARQFFRTRLGDSKEMTPDRSASLSVFLNRSPRNMLLSPNIQTNMRTALSEADVAAKAYNANECRTLNQEPCPTLTEDEEVMLRRIERVTTIKEAIATDISVHAQRGASSVANGVSIVANNIGNAVRRMGESTSHVIQCEVSPPEYKNCVTADGVTYVRSDNQAINNIREHARMSRGNRNSYNEQRNSARGQ